MNELKKEWKQCTSKSINTFKFTKDEKYTLRKEMNNITTQDLKIMIKQCSLEEAAREMLKELREKHGLLHRERKYDGRTDKED